MLCLGLKSLLFNSLGLKINKSKALQKDEPTQNELRKNWKNISLFWGNWNSGIEQMFISRFKDGWKQKNYKLKSQVLQLNGESRFKRRGGGIVPQRLETCVPVLLACRPQWKPRWTMVSLRYSIFGDIPFMCLAKQCLPWNIWVFVMNKERKSI